MKAQEVKNRLLKMIDEKKIELAQSINAATSYEEWKSINQQIEDILAAVNGIEIFGKLIKDQSETKTE